MDILAHALWSALVAKSINLKKKHKLSLLKTALWGIFPDLFAFTLLFIVLTLGTLSIITQVLYKFSHSLIIFSIIMLVLYVSFGKVIWEMLGWGLHILIDIPLTLTNSILHPFYGLSQNSDSTASPEASLGFHYSTIAPCSLYLE